jgi:hypothetical protein
MAERFEYDLNDNFEYQGEIPTMNGMFIGGCSVTILNTKHFSSTFDFSIFKSLSLYIPVGFAGTEITFYASDVDTDDELEMGECYDAAAVPAAITLTVAADRYVCPDPALLKGLLNMRFLKLNAVTAQTADMVIKIFALA